MKFETGTEVNPESWTQLKGSLQYPSPRSLKLIIFFHYVPFPVSFVVIISLWSSVAL